jgi:hypothetical protein
MDPEYAHRYRELHERHWWWRAREAAVLDRLRRLRPPRLPPPRVNRMLYLTSRFEQRSWGRLGLPLGSSILAVAAPRVDAEGR